MTTRQHAQLRLVIACMLVVAGCKKHSQPAVVAEDASTAKPAAMSASPAKDAGPAQAIDPNVAWSEDGRWIAWQTSETQVAVARTTDFVPVRTIKDAVRVTFSGDWLTVTDDTSSHFENPENGARMTSSTGAFEPPLVTKSSLVILDPSSPRMVSRADGKERALTIARSCAATADLSAATPASVKGELIALDVQCHQRGAPPCTGARGNCESGDSAAVVLDAARNTTTRLGEAFWAGADVVAFSPDGQKLLIAGQAASHADVIDPKTGRLVRRITIFPPGTGAGVGCAAWAPDGETLYVVVESAVLAFAVRSGARVARAEHPSLESFPSSCKAMVVNGFLLTAPSINKLLRLRLPKLDAPEALEHPIEGEVPEISPDGRFVVLADAKVTSLLDTRGWSRKAIEGPRAVQGLSFDPTSSFVAVGRLIWDLKASKRVTTLRTSP